MGEAVKVLVRCRPINERERKLNCRVVIDMDQNITQVQIRKPSENKENVPPKLFTFDGVYFIEDTTQQIYEEMCFPLVGGVLEGYNGTVFAYGQTGCGKSYSMMGVNDPIENKGVIPRAFEHIFDHIAVTEDIKFLVKASYLEIYNEEVRDLLGKDPKKKLDLHEHPEKGVYVKGLSIHKVHNVYDLERVMQLGSKNRSMGATLMNVDSSRSHSMFSIEIEMLDVHGDEEKLRMGKLNLVDLAGSERQSKTGSVGDRLKEAKKINLSLSALGNVISALVDGKSKHIPYRDSKLTRLLQSSLGGNTKTLMIACISPADNNYDETLSTLRYANRAKNIQNKPHINEDPKDALLREYQEEIQKLKRMLLGQMDVPSDLIGGDIAHQTHQKEVAAGVQQGSSADEQLSNWEEEKEALRREYEARIADLQEQFGREQTDKTKLQQDLDQIQTEWDAQLAAARDHYRQTDAQVTSLNQSLPLESGQPTGSSIEESVRETWNIGKDKQVLNDHAAALKRLEELQKTMIGGEKADDHFLRENLKVRRLVAEEREVHLREANDHFDDDNIMEQIFNSLTDEVRIKTHHIEKVQQKLRSAEEDVKDLNTEFELEREDFLDTIRNQDMQLKLCEQLLRTVVPCLRRDCNYYNMDKIKDDCKWNEDQSQWVLPKLVLTKPNFSPINTKYDKRGTVHSTNLSKQANTSDVRSNYARSGSYQLHTNTATSGACDKHDDDKHLSLHHQKFGQPEYFKPKRALELLGQTKDSQHYPEQSSNVLGLENNASGKMVNTSTAIPPNAATVHGIDTSVGDTAYSRRHGKLQSLHGTHPLPSLGNPHQVQRKDSMDKADKRFSRKKIGLGPLAEIKSRKSPHQ